MQYVKKQKPNEKKKTGNMNKNIQIKVVQTTTRYTQ